VPASKLALIATNQAEPVTKPNPSINTTIIYEAARECDEIAHLAVYGSFGMINYICLEPEVKGRKSHPDQESS
jgi:hypothetical protein